MSEKIYPVIIVEPISDSGLVLSNFFESDASCDVKKVQTPAEAKAMIAQLGNAPCAVLCCIESVPSIVSTIAFLREIDLKKNWSHIKVIAIGKSNLTTLIEPMRALSVSHFILEPVAARTLLFKGKMVLSTVKSLTDELLKASKDSFTIQGGQKQNEKTIEEPIAFRFTRKKPKRRNEKFLIEVDGPDSSAGSWEPEAVDASGEKNWAWKPKFSQGVTHKSKWKTQGEKPRFNQFSKKWEMESAKPNLVCEDEGEKPRFILAETEAGDLDLLKGSDPKAKATTEAYLKSKAEAVQNSMSLNLKSKPNAQSLNASSAKGTSEKISDDAAKKTQVQNNIQQKVIDQDSKLREDNEFPLGKELAFKKAGEKSSENDPDDPSRLAKSKERKVVPGKKVDDEPDPSEEHGKLTSRGFQAGKARFEDNTKVNKIPELLNQVAQAKKMSEPLGQEHQFKKTDLKNALDPTSRSLAGKSERELREMGKGNLEQGNLGKLPPKAANSNPIVKKSIDGEHENRNFQKKQGLNEDENLATSKEKQLNDEIEDSHKLKSRAQKEERRGTSLESKSKDGVTIEEELDHQAPDSERNRKGRKDLDVESSEQEPRKSKSGSNQTSKEGEGESDSESSSDSREKNNTESHSYADESASRSKLNAHDSEIEEADTVWKATNNGTSKSDSPLGALFYKKKIEISDSPGNWIKAGESYFFLKVSVKNGINLLQEAIPLWVYHRNTTPKFDSVGSRWVFETCEPLLETSSANLASEIILELKKYLREQNKFATEESQQSKDLKSHFEKTDARDSEKKKNSARDEDSNGIDARAERRRRLAEIEKANAKDAESEEAREKDSRAKADPNSDSSDPAIADLDETLGPKVQLDKSSDRDLTENGSSQGVDHPSSPDAKAERRRRRAEIEKANAKNTKSLESTTNDRELDADGETEANENSTSSSSIGKSSIAGAELTDLEKRNQGLKEHVPAGAIKAKQHAVVGQDITGDRREHKEDDPSIDEEREKLDYSRSNVLPTKKVPPVVDSLAEDQHRKGSTSPLPPDAQPAFDRAVETQFGKKIPENESLQKTVSKSSLSEDDSQKAPVNSSLAESLNTAKNVSLAEESNGKTESASQENSAQETSATESEISSSATTKNGALVLAEPSSEGLNNDEPSIVNHEQIEVTDTGAQKGLLGKLGAKLFGRKKNLPLNQEKPAGDSQGDLNSSELVNENSLRSQLNLGDLKSSLNAASFASPKSNRLPKSIAEAIAMSIGESHGKKDPDANERLPEVNHLALELAFAQIETKRISRSKTCQVIGDFCSIHLPRVRVLFLKNQGDRYLVLPNRGEIDKNVIRERLQRRNGLFRLYSRQDGDLIVFLEKEDGTNFDNHEMRTVYRLGIPFAPFGQKNEMQISA